MKYVVDSLIDLYLEQRREMSGGDDSIFLGDPPQLYRIWRWSKRPETALESAMHRWTVSETGATIQIAGHVLLGLVSTELAKQENMPRKRDDYPRRIDEEDTYLEGEDDLRKAPSLEVQVVSFSVCYVFCSPRRWKPVAENVALLLAEAAKREVEPETLVDVIIHHDQKMRSLVELTLWTYRNRRMLTAALATSLLAIVVTIYILLGK
jgi:hypothetical protein